MRVFIRIVFITITISLICIEGETGLSVGKGLVTSQEMRRLTLGGHTQLTLAGGQKHRFNVVLKKDDFFHIAVQQEGIDVVVTIYDPTGAKVAEVDSPNGKFGLEPVFAIARKHGDYTIEIKSLETAAKPGRYEISLQEIRKATDTDRKRVAVAQAFTTATILRLQRTRESMQQAISKLKEVLVFRKAGKDSGKIAEMLYTIADTYANLDEYQRAIEYYREALHYWRKLNDLRSAAQTSNDMGTQFYRLGNLDEAIKHYNKSIPLWRATKNRHKEAQTMRNMAVVTKRLGRPEDALPYFLKVIPLWKELHDSLATAEALFEVGMIYKSMDRYGKTLDYYSESSALFRAIKDSAGISKVANDFGLVYTTLGDYQQALEQYEISLTIDRKLDDQFGMAASINNMGLVRHGRGDFQEALGSYEDALRIWESLSRSASSKRTLKGLKKARAHTLDNVGTIFLELGEPRQALERFEQALQLNREIGNRESEAVVLNNMSVSYTKMAEFEKGLELLNRSLMLRESLNSQDSDGKATVYLNIGKLYDQKEEPGKSLNYYGKALDTFKKTGNQPNEARTLLNMASAFGRLGQLNKSLDYFDSALRRFEILKNASGMARALAGRAEIEFKLDKLASSERDIDKAVSIVETIRGEVSSDYLKTSFFSSTRDFYALFIKVLWQSFVRHHDDFSKAFSVSERAHSRSLLDLVYSGKASHLLTEVAPPLRLHFLLNQEQLQRTRETLMISIANKDSASVQRAEEKISYLENQQSKVLHEIKLSNPRYYQLLNPEIATAQDVSESLPSAHLALLEYFVADSAVWVWTVTKHEIYQTRLAVPRSVLMCDLGNEDSLWHKGDHRSGSETDRIVDIAPTDNVTSPREMNPQRLKDLYELILQEPLEKLEDKPDQLIIIPDDILFYLPFEMLVTRFEQGKPRFLVEEYAVSYSPSASLLNPQLRRETHPSTELIAFGNPFFGEEKKKSTAAVLTTFFKTIFRGDRWTPLPYSETEVREISHEFSNTAVLLGKNATESNFKARARNARYLHIATHYLVDDRQPMFSKIVFAQNTAERNEDGYLHTFEVFNLHLNAELVTLSACNSALGGFMRGEGLMGISRAFMYAGVPSLVVSLWPVEDETTAFLMSQFYKYLAAGMAKNLALQKAKIDLIHSSREKNSPFYWAPFVLIGHPD